MLERLIRLFKSGGNGGATPPKPGLTSYSRYLPGDYIYTADDDGYHVSLVLAHEPDQNGVHVALFEKLERPPTPEQVRELVTVIQHVPMSIGGLNEPILLTHRELETEDFGGYHVYLEATEQAEYIPWHFLERANACSERGDHRRALRILEECIEAFPDFYFARDNAGFAHMSLGELAPAIQRFEQSLELAPDGVAATFSIGECLMKLGRYGEAREWFERALVLKPDLKVAAELRDACRAEEG